MSTPTDTSTRRWRLRGYSCDSPQPQHDSTVTSDRDLDTAMKRLEADRFIVRIAVQPL